MNYHYDSTDDYAQWLEHVADDCEVMAQSTSAINDRHPIPAWLLGAAFAYRQAAYDIRAIDD